MSDEQQGNTEPQHSTGVLLRDAGAGEAEGTPRYVKGTVFTTDPAPAVAAGAATPTFLDRESFAAWKALGLLGPLPAPVESQAPRKGTAAAKATTTPADGATATPGPAAAETSGQGEG